MRALIWIATIAIRVIDWFHKSGLKQLYVKRKIIRILTRLIKFMYSKCDLANTPGGREDREKLTTAAALILEVGARQLDINVELDELKQEFAKKNVKVITKQERKRRKRRDRFRDFGRR